MDNSNRSKMVAIIKASAAIAFPAALAALLLCSFLLGNQLLEMLTPLLLTALFCVLCFLLERIPFTRDRKRLKITLQLICAILAGVLLGL